MSFEYIRLKSLKDPTEESDGLRILIARFRPRYLRKEEENWNEWWKELAPSRSLWKEYLKDKKIDWEEYSKRYIEEIKGNAQAIKALYKLSYHINNKITKKSLDFYSQKEEHRLSDNNNYLRKFKVVTLLCHCRDETHCHRSIVKGMVNDSKLMESFEGKWS